MLFHAGVNASSTLYPIPVDIIQSNGSPDIVALGMAFGTWVVTLVLLSRDGHFPDPRRNIGTTASSR